jgi:hypothetical protein
VDKVSFRLATPADIHLPTYDNTKLVAFNTCPTWGVMTYAMHKKMPGAGRAMPLECGTVMHEMFSWVRLCILSKQLRELAQTNGGFDHSMAAFMHHGLRLFGQKRFSDIISQAIGIHNHIDHCKTGAIAVLETSGYYDDPSDKRRTLTNMIECALAYIDKVRWEDHVWMRDVNDPCGDVGIEIPFDVVVSTTFKGEDVFVPHDESGKTGNYVAPVSEWRYTGKIDGIHWHNGILTLQENKTASRLNDAWSMSFSMASQVTGYCIAASVFTEGQVRNADVMGITVPLPKSYDYGGIVNEPVTRQDYHFTQWITWALHTVDGYESYQGNPYGAPKYTHSCNRYFRPCSLLPFCDSERGDQERTVSEMIDHEWSPLHEKAGD